MPRKQPFGLLRRNHDMWYFTWILGIGFAVLLAIVKRPVASHATGRDPGSRRDDAAISTPASGDAGIEQLVEPPLPLDGHRPGSRAHHLHGPDLGEVKRRLGAF